MQFMHGHSIITVNVGHALSPHNDTGNAAVSTRKRHLQTTKFNNVIVMPVVEFKPSPFLPHNVMAYVHLFIAYS